MPRSHTTGRKERTLRGGRRVKEEMVEGLALRRRWGERPSRSRGWGPHGFYYMEGSTIVSDESLEP